MRDALANAMLHWKFAFGITATRPEIQCLSHFSFGEHSVGYQEICLSPKEQELAFSALEHTSTFLCVNQTHAVLDKFDEPSEGSDEFNAFHISRLLRNSFAHDPFSPVWLFGEKWENRFLEVPGVIAVDTGGLRGQRVVRAHYGGPLAILRLTQYVDALVAGKQ